MRIRSIFVVLALAVTVTRPASAQLTQVSGMAGLNGTLTTHDFEAGNTGPGATYGPNTWFDACNATGCVTSSGTHGIVSYPNPFTITFNNPTTAVGMFFGNDDTCCGSPFTAFLDAYNGSGFIGSVGVNANMNDWADQFIGFNSSVNVDYVQVRYGPGSRNLAIYVDDVTFNDGASTVTPEPASLALLATGLVGIGGIARRRRQQ